MPILFFRSLIHSSTSGGGGRKGALPDLWNSCTSDGWNPMNNEINTIVFNWWFEFRNHPQQVRFTGFKKLMFQRLHPWKNRCLPGNVQFMTRGSSKSWAKPGDMVALNHPQNHRKFVCPKMVDTPKSMVSISWRIPWKWFKMDDFSGYHYDLHPPKIVPRTTPFHGRFMVRGVPHLSHSKIFILTTLEAQRGGNVDEELWNIP